jgi:DNA modification methylase
MSSDLTPEDRDLVKRLLDEGSHIPERFRASLFADAAATELVWPGKTTRVETAVLPFQSIEHVDEPRVETSAIPSLFEMDSGSGRQVGGWTNKLIWGDNRLILSSLANGPMRREIEDAGGLQLVYIDPPFDVGADFSMDVSIGDDSVTKNPSIIEEIAYRDTWGRGTDSYVAMMRERIALIHSLLAESGTLVVHSGIQVNHVIRLITEEVFGRENIIDEIIWSYGTASGGRAAGNKLVKVHEYLLVASKDRSAMTYNKIYLPYSEKYIEERFNNKDADGRMYQARKRSSGVVERQYLDEALGVPLSSVWSDIRQTYALHLVRRAKEETGYPTQKPEDLLSRVVTAYSNEGDLVGDFFCGSGTTPAVAEKLGRKWIAADLGRFAIHTTRKRLIAVQRDLKADGGLYRAFEVLNLGAYERQHLVGMSNSRDEGAAQHATEREEKFVGLILSAYAAQRATSAPPFHGIKGSTAVLIGPIDAPVTERQVREAIDAAVTANITRVDILGFEFEMGLKTLLQDEARSKGVNLALRYIPNEVFDTRAVKSGDVKFHDVAFVEFRPSVSGRSVSVALGDFAVFYRQEDAEAAAAGLRSGATRVVVDDGQVVKVSKDKKGLINREVLTTQWTDWIDYWAVDFDYLSQPELTRSLVDGVEQQAKTGRFVFENRWQSFRTKSSRDLELVSAAHEYPADGEYHVAVKVIDIFGNDTTRVLPVVVKG